MEKFLENLNDELTITGIILSGGAGTRMGLFTQRVANKHLMPIYDKLMIEFPIHTLVNSGITTISIVTGNRYSGQFVDVLGNGKEWGIRQLSYAYQFGEGGIADALRCAKPNIPPGSNIAVCLGDNIFEQSFKKEINDFCIETKTQKSLCHLFLKKVVDPNRFGVACFDDNEFTSIIEKPPTGFHPDGLRISDLAVTGLYLYTYDVFDYIEKLKPSGRGELEVTDLNNFYLKNGNCKFTILDTFWHDAGTPDSLLICSEWCKNKARGYK